MVNSYEDDTQSVRTEATEICPNARECKNDVERVFDVLQFQWGIAQNPALTWSTQKLWEAMTACVIMHKMIVEDERDDSIYDLGFDF